MDKMLHSQSRPGAGTVRRAFVSLRKADSLRLVVEAEWDLVTPSATRLRSFRPMASLSSLSRA
jgi:hypothetical protein